MSEVIDGLRGQIENENGQIENDGDKFRDAQRRAETLLVHDPDRWLIPPPAAPGEQVLLFRRFPHGGTRTQGRP